jgi:threonylcarbamoyladenosine tRNA methylthiotransferase MtaB
MTLPNEKKHIRNDYLCANMSKVAFHTLGCKLNFSETSTLARQFRDAGWEKVDFSQSADVYVVNTCSVTENADRECRQIVNRAMHANGESKVIIVGCYAQLKPEAISEIPGVSLVLGATEKFNVLRYLDQVNQGEKAQVMACEIDDANEFVSSYSSDDRTRVFLKVQDGCDYNCSFCTIPLARGKSRSDTIANVVRQAEHIVSSGVKEIVLTGVNLGDFGIRDQSAKHRDQFIDLGKALEEVEGLERIRISSIEPNLLTDDVIRFVAESKKFVPHFHIPLQSGADVLLKRMRRRYLTALYRERITLIKELMPHAGIGVDVIVGFPGETEALFLETVDFLQSINVSYLHVFTYSERPNTLAIEMEDIVPVQVRKQRNKVLRNLSLKKQRSFYESQVGRSLPVLFEAEKNGDLMFGYTSNYVRVAMEYDAEKVNCIIDCEIIGIHPEGFAEVSEIEIKTVC